MEQQGRRYEMESEIVNRLKYVYDPEIPVNVYDLGLIYDVELTDDLKVKIRMTLTAPNCPMADELIREIHETVSAVKGVREVEINLVFDPPWDKDMMSDEARLELGLL
ncbi:MAG TPA: SUF system Fe-S cluster assembly protein [Bacteroidetes bacterium]|nr:SUF system Fe-S cluster assembly protein [Bacteroidota bacterium]